MNPKMLARATVLLAVAATAIIPILLFSQTANAIIAILIGDFVPIATSGDNVYVV